MMHSEEIRALDAAGLQDAIETARKEIFNLRFRKTTGQLSDASRIRAARRSLARLLTVQREQQIWAAYEATMEGEG
jgi:large subunit ribosomal protein L29